MGSIGRNAGGAIFCALLVSAGAAAHETDQFTVPVGKELADLGEYFTALAYDTIEAGVSKTNANIRRALEADRSTAYIARLQSPDELTENVFSGFTPAFFFIEDLEKMVHSERTMKKYPGRLVGHKEAVKNIYQHVHFVLDPRQLFRLWQASTVNVFGTYVGTDKIGHFTDVGYQYYRAYRKAIDAGLGEEQALKEAVEVGTKGLRYAETGVLGNLSVGAYSNADLASNYAGFKFYKNLTQETRIRGRMYPPVVRREGDYWRISPHVRRNSDFFRAFITDHFNEALNPSLFEEGMRRAIREAVKKRSAGILRWYADDNDNRRPKEHFDTLTEELTTYYGEDYGHRGSYDELITIGNTCFDEPPDGDQLREGSANGYSLLHWAALRGDAALAQEVLDAGAEVDEPVRSLEEYSCDWGSTPLHSAAASGNGEMVRLLLDHGANVNAANESGATPLHRAIDHPQIIETLIAHGADVNARDERGRTPLHWSARYPNAAAVELLIAGGAAVDARDHAGETPLHRAALWGHVEMMDMLLSAGAHVNARANFETTSLHFASRQSDPAVVELLIRSGADVHAADEFGWTVLHDLAKSGRAGLAPMLLVAGADADAADHYGSTPLHVAARYGREDVAALLLACGADVNGPNSIGSRPLHEAVCAGHTSLVNLLLEHDADVRAKNIKGQSALDLALSGGNRLVTGLLLSSARANSGAMIHQTIDVR